MVLVDDNLISIQRDILVIATTKRLKILLLDSEMLVLETIIHLEGMQVFILKGEGRFRWLTF